MNFINGFVEIFNSRELGQLSAIGILVVAMIAVVALAATWLTEKGGLR